MASFLRKSVVTHDPLLHPIISELISSSLLDNPVTHMNLVKLGEKIDMTSKQRVENNAQVFRLTDVIQTKLQVARFYVSGSYGRRVTVGTPEVDLVVFLRSNQKLPPYDNSADDILPRLHAELLIALGGKSDISISPLSPSGCVLGSSEAVGRCRHRKVAGHRCCPGFIKIVVKDAHFRILLAPALGRNSEEQRQAAYRHMLEVYMKFGLKALDAWHPSLIEKPSEAMAQSTAVEQAFIRVCQYWVQVNQLPTLSRYAVETLAHLVAKHLKREAESNSSHAHDEESVSSQEGLSLDLLKAFRLFLNQCSSLSTASQLCEIEPPAKYVSPWTEDSNNFILFDNFNPYRNLLGDLSPADHRKLKLASHRSLEILGNPDAPLSSLFLSSRVQSSLWSSFWRLVFSLLVLLAAWLLHRADWQVGAAFSHVTETINNDAALLWAEAPTMEQIMGLGTRLMGAGVRPMGSGVEAGAQLQQNIMKFFEPK